MINLLFIIALNFTAAMAEEANLDLKNQCAQNQEKSAWIKNQLEAKGYSVNQKDAGPLYLDLGTRNEVLVLWVNPQDCVAVLQSFEMLEKIKKNNMLFQGVSVVYSDQFKFTKISLKDFSLPLNVSINSFLKNLEKLDKNPIEALDLSMLSDDFKKINPELKKNSR